MSTAAQSTHPVIEMRGISKSYPGVRALDGVSLTVMPGEVHALVGENGAGKSTLMKILAGAQPRDAGDIIMRGEVVTIDGPQRAMDLGISIIYQEFNLVPYLNAAENIFLGREPGARIPGFVDFRRMYREAQEVVDRLGVKLDVRAPVHTLSIAQQQMVEIAKATSRKSSVIVMDEPSATLTEHELVGLFKLIRQLQAEGVGIVYISHRLEEVFEIADRVTVLRDGRHIATHGIAELTRDDIIRLMVGRELTQMIPKVPAPIGDAILEVQGLSRRNVLQDINLTVRKGEVLGVAGLVGSGRTELARAIFGADRFDAGQILLDGKPVRVRSPQDAIRLGIGLVTEDRKAQGLVLGMAVRENVTLANLAAISRFNFIMAGRERGIAQGYVSDLGIRTPSIEQTVQNLSGGNQQKVVLAKWLFTDSRVLIFDEPTRGIDVGAKTEIYQLINDLAAKGVGIIMISSELPEVLGMSDRIVVMHEGRIVGAMPASEATQVDIMHLATGGK